VETLRGGDRHAERPRDSALARDVGCVPCRASATATVPDGAPGTGWGRDGPSPRLRADTGLRGHQSSASTIQPRPATWYINAFDQDYAFVTKLLSFEAMLARP
jgi:hypothetical protein